MPEQRKVTDWPESEAIFEPGVEDISELTPLGGEHSPRTLADRIHRAAELNVQIFPVAPGIYHVTSGNSDETYVVDLDGYVDNTRRGVCECKDYRYRTAEAGVDCKHIIAVKWNIKSGVLPGVDEDPVEWLHTQLDRLESQSLTRDQEALIEQVRENPYKYEYRYVVDKLKGTTKA